jgi:beta-mannosidase
MRARACFWILLWMISPCLLEARADRDRMEAETVREIDLSGRNWKLGSYPIGEGEKQNVYLPGFDDHDFRTVTVPGEVQLQLGLKGMDLYYQSPELSLVNEKEWWYRQQFVAPNKREGKLTRLEFAGVDYYATVWLNGERLGDHEGAYVPFSYDVSSKVKWGSQNTLVVKVTCPWTPKDRSFLEYLKGNWVMVVPWNITFPHPPNVLGPFWDGVPAYGNALLPMGLFRNVKLVVSGSAVVADVFVHTKQINEDGSAKLEISGTVKNYGEEEVPRVLEMKIAPETFTGLELSLPDESMVLHPGENTFRREVIVKDAHLWWTWDLGKQDLYRLTTKLSSGVGTQQKYVVFGIRTISRKADMSYWLNGKRLFLKGAWEPSDYFGSATTKETYEKDLRLYRGANLNHIVNFTVLEKPAFYDLCDQLGILVIVELPFPQFGPMAVLAPTYPRRNEFIKGALGQVENIVVQLRNHPSVIEWAAFAEVHQKNGGGWGFGAASFEAYDYGPFSDEVGKAVMKLDPGAIYQASLCDLGEEHFWLAPGGIGADGSYNQFFTAEAGLISEYGSMSLPAYQTLQKELSSEDLWSDRNEALPQWFGLPINVAAYSYLSSYEYDGLFSLLDRTNQVIDRHIRSPQELVDDTQLYQAFLLKYATEAFRRKMHEPVNGVRFWAYGEDWPGVHWGIVDYDRVPKMSYYFVKQAQERFELNFAFEDALESQPSGKELRIPLWIVNDYRRQVPVEVRAQITDLQGRKLWGGSFHSILPEDSSRQVGEIVWTTPESPGVYELKAGAVESGGMLQAENSTYIKVTPRLFAKPVRVLVIGERKTAVPIAAMLQAMGLAVRKIEEEEFHQLNELRDSEAIRKNYDVVWLGSFDSLWKLLGNEEAKGLEEAISQGVAFIHTGGLGSFHGGFGRGAALDLTPLAEVLPVALKKRNDVTYGRATTPEHRGDQKPSNIVDIEVAEEGTGGSADLLRQYGLPRFNDVELKSTSKELLRIAGRPLLVSGHYGRGRTLAFTGFTPEGVSETAYWNSNVTFPYLLDQELYSKPETRAYFDLFMRMITTVTAWEPATEPGKILAAHEMPLFEMLKGQPQADVITPKSVEAKVRDGTGKITLKLRNHDKYARLVRLRAEWNTETKNAPFLLLYSDNYFDLLPNETKEVEVDAFVPPGVAGTIKGSFVVEGTNITASRFPVVLLDVQ